MSNWIWGGTTHNSIVGFTTEQLHLIAKALGHERCGGFMCDTCYLRDLAEEAERVGRKVVDFHRHM